MNLAQISDLLHTSGFASDVAMTMAHPLVRWPITITYVLVLLVIAVYGLHRYWLVFLYYRGKRRRPRRGRTFAQLPRVTVQLPMYNEMHVAERVIDAAAQLDYPRDRLQIQVVDDSTDASADIARRCCEKWAERGVDICYEHRTDRAGFKAGALGEALARATGEFVAVFDADFIPPPGFLRRCVHYFTDPGVGMVQARWGHLNRAGSLLTRAQAVLLDGHFVIEHTARNRSGCWFNFNGTAGVWRRATIDDAGGWQAHTLTEDVDLSYRAQLRGWRFVYLPRMICDAELPPEVNAFKSQQHRWAKGTIQNARALLPRILASDAPAVVKSEAFFHLTSPIVYVCTTLLVLLYFPALVANSIAIGRDSALSILLGLSLLMVGAVSAGTFYIASQREQRLPLGKTLLHIPLLMSVGVGITLNNARGVIEALFGLPSEFVRTPKYRVPADAEATPGAPSSRAALAAPAIPIPSIKAWTAAAELMIGLYLAGCAVLCATHLRAWASVPFLVMFSAGYLYVGLHSLAQHRRAATASIAPRVAATA